MTITRTFLALAALLTTANAEITDDTMRGLQERAAEKIEIEVVKTSMLPLPTGSSHKVEAKVTAVTESASGLKVGDRIVIRYHVTNAPGSNPRAVEKGRRYKAYLRLDPKKKGYYEEVAGRGSFVAVASP